MSVRRLFFCAVLWLLPAAALACGEPGEPQGSKDRSWIDSKRNLYLSNSDKGTWRVRLDGSQNESISRSVGFAALAQHCPACRLRTSLQHIELVTGEQVRRLDDGQIQLTDGGHDPIVLAGELPPPPPPGFKGETVVTSACVGGYTALMGAIAGRYVIFIDNRDDCYWVYDAVSKRRAIIGKSLFTTISW